MLSRLGSVATLAIALLCAVPLPALRPVEAPRLPPPDPEGMTLVEVDSAQELADACWNLVSGTAIVIAPGVYDLAAVDFPNGVDGRLTVGRYGAPPISNVELRGATGDPADVVLLGAGMLDDSVPFGIQIFTATDVTIADLSVGSVYYHAIAIQGDQGAERVRIYHVRAFDAGQQIVKASGGGADDVVIEFSEVFYTAGAVQHPEGSPPGSCYTNGIDAIEVRYATATGVEVRANLLDAAVQARDGATPTIAGNETGADPSWFVDLDAADLRLTPSAGAAIAAVGRLADAADDFAAWTRPDPPALTDLGARAYPLLFRDGFESGSLAPWSGSTSGAP